MMRIVVLGCVAAILLIVAVGLRACKTARPTPPARTPPVVLATQACVDCHNGQARLWRDGGHHELSCETCHGPGKVHVMALTKPNQPRPEMPPTGGASACLGCHHQLKSFEEHVKAVEAKHIMKANVERAGGQCVYCHDPHSLQ